MTYFSLTEMLSASGFCKQQRPFRNDCIWAMTEAVRLLYLQYSRCQITVKVIWASREIIGVILVLSVKTFKFPFH